MRCSQHLATATRNHSDIVNFNPAINTRYSRIMWGKHNRQIGSNMVQDDGHLKFSQFCPVRASKGLDSTLLANIIEYRKTKYNFDLKDDGTPDLPFGVDNELIIPKCRALSVLSNETDEVGEAVPDVNNPKTELLDMWMHKEIVKGLDSQGLTVNFAVDVLTIRSVAVGIEPLIALDQITKNIPSVADSALSVFSHMSRVLKLYNNTSIGLQDYFVTKSPFSAPRICADAQLPLAVFEFARDHGLTRVHYGGFRMDVSMDSVDMTYYKEYIGFVEENRVSHYNLVSAYSTQFFVNPRGYKKHVCTEYQLDMWAGVCYWKIPLDQIDQELESVPLSDRVGETWQSLVEWRSSELLCDKTWAYIPDEHGMHRNTGCKIKINNDAFQSWMSIRRKQDKECESLLDLDPLRVCPMWRLYIETRLQERDQMSSFFTHNAVATVDLRQLREINTSQLRPEMIELKDVLHGFMSERPMDMLDVNTLRENDIRKLYGMLRPDFSMAIDRMWGNVPLDEVLLLQQNLISTSLRNALTLMNNGELEQWKYLAMVIFNVEQNKHGDFAQLFLTENITRNTILRTKVLNEELNLTPLDETQMMALTVTEFSERRLNLDLFRQNLWTYKVLTYSLNATFSYKKGYGYPVKVGDMAHDITVIDRGTKTPTEVNWNIKTPGAGLDTTLETLMQTFNSFGEKLVPCDKLREFYHNKKNKDHTANKISEGAMSQLMGSGLKVDEKGKFLWDSQSYVTEAGLAIHLNELDKRDYEQEAGQKFMSVIELSLNSSGEGHGTYHQNWISTSGMKPFSMVKALPVPFGLIGGNRLNKTIGSSTFGGGRMQVCASGVRDDSTGILVIKKVQKGVNAPTKSKFSSPSASGHNQHAYNSPSPMIQNLLEVPLENYIQNEMIPLELANTCPSYLWEMFLTRRLPFLMRTLHLEYKEHDYYILSNVSSILKNINFAIKGLDRNYLRLDPDSMGRNLGGPLRTCLMQGIYHTQIINWCTQRMLRFSTSSATSSSVQSSLLDMDKQDTPGAESVKQAKADPKGKMPYTSADEQMDVDSHDKDKNVVSVHFMKSITNMVASMLYVPLTVTAILAASHVWLLTNVLDISCMVLVCFMGYFTGLEEYCPLQVLALVARRQKLTVQQKRQYFKICHHLAPVVFSKSVSINIDPRVKKVNSKAMQMLDCDVFDEWLDWNDPESKHQEIMEHRRKRTQNFHASVYLTSTLPLHYRGNSAFARDVKTKDTKTKVRIPFCGTTWNQMAAHIFAMHQTKQAYADRIRQGVIMQEWHNLHLFWEAAQSGTRLPKPPETKRGHNDKYMPDFAAVYETGHWFEQCFEKIGNLTNPMCMFLAVCGLPTQISHRDFFRIIMQPFVDEVCPDAEVIDNDEWNSSIVGDMKRVFSWSVCPIAKDSKYPCGVEVNLCMKVAYYLLMQGMVCEFWKRSDSKNADEDEDSDDEDVDGQKDFENVNPNTSPSSASGKVALNLISKVPERQVIVHLRNMEAMSRAVMFLFVHTMIEKAVIPANDGQIVLPITSGDKDSQTASRIIYDERLHVDSWYDTKDQKPSDNMLCMQERIKSSSWKLIKVHDTETIYYNNLMSGMIEARDPATLFPFPPESVAHMPVHYQMMKRAVMKKMDEIESFDSLHQDSNFFLPAMLEFGRNVVGDHIEYIPLQLTHCVVQGGEIPCVTYSGYCFTVQKIFDDLILFIPAIMTHGKTYLNASSTLCFSQLPLSGDAVISCLDFGNAMSRGLQWEESGLHKTRQLTLNVDGHNTPEPFYFWPLVRWPHLVCVGMHTLNIKGIHFNGSFDLHAMRDKSTLDTEANQDSKYYQIVTVDEFITSARSMYQTMEAKPAREYLKKHGVSVPKTDIEDDLIIFEMDVQGGAVSSGTGKHHCICMLVNDLHDEPLSQDQDGKQKEPQESGHWTWRIFLSVLEVENFLSSYKKEMPSIGVWTKKQYVLLYESLPYIIHKIDGHFLVYITRFEDEARRALKTSLVQTQKLVNSLTSRVKQLQMQGETVAATQAEMQRTERANEYKQIEERLRQSTINTHVIDHIYIGKKIIMTRCISKPRAANELAFGFILPFVGIDTETETNSHDNVHYHGKDDKIERARYLNNGRYKIKCLYNNALGNVVSTAEMMDFTTASQCIIREGQELFMLLDKESLADLNRLLLGPYSRTTSEFQQIQSIREGKSWAFLKVFYVLGGTEVPVDNDSFRETTIAVGVAVNDEVGKACVYVLRARVFSDRAISSLDTTDACQRILLHPRNDSVVYDRAMRVKQKHGSKQTSHWIWKL